MIRVRLKIQTGNLNLSRSIVNAVKPDNLGMKGLLVEDKANNDMVQFLLTYEGKIETFISTLDDMLACVQAATGTLRTISRNTK